LVILQKSPTSTGYFSNSTGSSATNCQFFPDIGTERQEPTWQCDLIGLDEEARAGQANNNLKCPQNNEWGEPAVTYK
jgi:hypothetical protein